MTGPDEALSSCDLQCLSFLYSVPLQTMGCQCKAAFCFIKDSWTLLLQNNKSGTARERCKWGRTHSRTCAWCQQRNCRSAVSMGAWRTRREAEEIVSEAVLSSLNVGKGNSFYSYLSSQGLQWKQSSPQILELLSSSCGILIVSQASCRLSYVRCCAIL